jgi:hypothetical protein
MRIVVEPEDGHELDRLVTALLSATGVVHRAIGDEGLTLATQVVAGATLMMATELGLEEIFAP